MASGCGIPGTGFAHATSSDEHSSLRGRGAARPRRSRTRTETCARSSRPSASRSCRGKPTRGRPRRLRRPRPWLRRPCRQRGRTRFHARGALGAERGAVRGARALLTTEVEGERARRRDRDPDAYTPTRRSKPWGYRSQSVSFGIGMVRSHRVKSRARRSAPSRCRGRAFRSARARDGTGRP